MPKRQWGSDTRSALPVVPAPASESTMLIGQLAIAVTVIGWALFVITTLTRSSLGGGDDGAPALGVSTILYIVIMTLLACSALAYLTTRLGYYSRTRSHRRATRAELSQPFERSAPTLTVLIPSYQEDMRVNRMTLLSAALQEYPDLELVLLIDDPPQPRYARPAQMLIDAQGLPGEIEALLGEPKGRFQIALDCFETKYLGGGEPNVEDIWDVAREYEHAAQWLARYGGGYEVIDHADRFLVDRVLLGLAEDMEASAQALRAAAGDGARLTHDHLRHLLQRLTWIFGARITSFQRKRFVSLSHEPNKAMNLNSYIGLMGGSYNEVEVPGGGLALLHADGDADLVVRNPDYVLTLDADSLLLPEYCLRIVHLLQQQEHSRVAVAQAPYTAFPGAATRLERMAGATTDLQHMVHQGMTHYDATFWVGANAVLRKRAIDDLRDVSHDGDWSISRFISDRTVIEDTESSIDLGVHGWRLLNYPERLSYSATPPDFGALCIQRQRWANGGLLILPGLWRQIRTRRARGERQKFGETFLRINYMASICWSSIALIFLLLFQFNDRLISPLVLLISIPYFAMMAVDLKHCGYRRSDVLGLYGFNLVLLAVNIAGVGASLLQVLVGGRPAFKRTPKVRSRTTPGLTFIVMPYVFVVFSVLTLLSDLDRDRWVNVTLAGLNAVLASYAIVAYIGLFHSVVDVYTNVTSWLYKPQKSARVKRAARRAAAAAVPPAPHWSQTLAYAPADGVRRAERRSRSGRSGSAADRRNGSALDRDVDERRAVEDRRDGPGRRETDVAAFMGRRASDRPSGRADDREPRAPERGRRADDDGQPATTETEGWR
ncbi:glycosyltransferase family 2 protein [Conexibacter sp. CPCC 206217]|uniref:glycosyltransferase family 2 protein n=1 Tax=Conexibacter sp. CPCC 206217 TaxID=3064574 RepID=UPI00271FAE1E|nr:glycosyltransferase family 2 protein [Conexibacter sp. CPCC 206217]MDO8211645.1 glycosyltransferase family 2 protein [Conexibacter sp. CPCC 206217]